MTRDEMLTQLKETINCAVSGGAWSDDLLLSYLAEGQDKFCEDTGFFIDATNYELDLTTTETQYALDADIIKVLSVWSGNSRLPETDMEGLDPYQEPSFVTTVPTASSQLPVWQVDYETGYLTLRTAPIEDMTVKLRVWRYARNRLNNKTSGNYDTEPEIPVRYHSAPIEWAAYKALNHHGAEQQDPVKAKDHLAIYKQYAKEGYRAMRRRMGVMTRLTPSPTYLLGID